MKTKEQIQLELDSYFDELMHLATNPNFPISANIMHKYFVVPTMLKIMMCMILDELDRGSRTVYPDVMEERVRFYKDVTLERKDTIVDYRSWHQLATVDKNEDVEELVFQHLSKS